VVDNRGNTEPLYENLLFTSGAGCEAASEEEASELTAEMRPHLAVVDLSLEKGDGLFLIKRLRKLRPALKFLVFSMHDQVDITSAAFIAGRTATSSRTKARRSSSNRAASSSDWPMLPRPLARLTGRCSSRRRPRRR
jgi:DNA-binding NtrC family response regulator